MKAKQRTDTKSVLTALFISITHYVLLKKSVLILAIKKETDGLLDDLLKGAKFAEWPTSFLPIIIYYG